MSGKENYGVVKQVVTLCAEDLVVELRALNSRAALLEAGHNRWKLIDGIMLKGMGKDVRRYWAAQTETYKSLLRRKVWEKALLDMRRPRQ